MNSVIALDVTDVRFPTSRVSAGSDVMHPDPDYSAAYVVIRTSSGDAGYSLVFTIGRGNDVQCAAIKSFESRLMGRDVSSLLSDLGRFSRDLADDSQLRWLGPEKGVMHMAAGAVINALWDLKARIYEKPLWLLLSELSIDELIENVDFRYLGDALTPSDAREILKRAEPGKAAAIERLRASGYPAYTSSAGWIGYDDQRMIRALRQAVAQGFTMVKLKVGADLRDDRRRLKAVRKELGPSFPIAVDANQAWEVPDAITWIDALREFDPYWVEEPTSPDDILGHLAIRSAVAPVRIAAGEQVHNRIVFKQLLQAQALDVLQLDATRVGGVGENITILLLAAKFGVPVYPHAGGVGLCEMVQHLSMFDAVAVSGQIGPRRIEYIDHLHEHFEDPVAIRNGAYMPPSEPGGGAQMKKTSVHRHSYPHGEVWKNAKVEQREWETDTRTSRNTPSAEPADARAHRRTMTTAMTVKNTVTRDSQ